MVCHEPLKIVYCNPSLHIAGGIERVLSVKANYFAENLGYEVHIVITDGKKKEPFFDLHPSIKVHQLDINYDEWLPPYRRFFCFLQKRKLHIKRLNKLLAQIQPDITILLVRREVSFVHRMTDSSIKIAENHIDKNRYLTSINPLLAKYVPHFLLEYWKAQYIKKVKSLDRFVVLTSEDKQSWDELKNVIVIPNPLTFLPDKISLCTSKQVIAVGRYERQKGFDMLISVWKKVTMKYPDWILRIFGDGSLRGELELQVIQEGITNNCFLDFPVKNIADKYAESSISVLSSRFEGFGLVIIEAMCCGLPVVSFECPCGPRDIIRDQEDGILVEKGNVEKMEQSILRLIENEEERRQMGKNALQNVQRYHMENIVVLWKELFEELLQHNTQLSK
ncbi:glycosyltransferase family 4 protein [Bacteroides timonensis]|uniref:glycosyltransferase family 4 protein n=1 Tax=Bacteroides timonensis TaxID=1470345 RepID=UPI0004B9321F|nr:glycosyltransferase family 4 protein [Bacteroides timonensis]